MFYEADKKDRDAGTLPVEILEAVNDAISMQGFAVIGGLVSAQTRERLYDSVLEDVEQIREPGKLTPHEERTAEGHLQLGLRRYAPFVCEDLVANPLIESVVAAVLGSGAWLGFYNGNVNCPGSGDQPLHFDRPYSWRTEEEAAAHNQPWPPPTTTLSCSVALNDISAETGATEIYIGSQRETAVATWTTNRLGGHPELIEAWGPPARMEIPAGGVCFRDPRMWHRGVCNHGTAPRPMLALTYHAAKALHWRGRMVLDATPALVQQCESDLSLRVMDDGSAGDGRLAFHESAAPAFATPSRHGINRNVRFVEAPLEVNHLLGAHEVGGALVTNPG